MAGKSTTIIYGEYDLLVLLGILNSRLISFYYSTVFGGNTLQGGYLRIGQSWMRSTRSIPGNLVASLNAVGNGISILDNSGAGSLIVDDNAVSDALGLNGEETTGNPATPLVGRDVNPRRAGGVFSILQSLETALQTGDNVELARLSKSIDVESDRFNQLRGEIGSRLKLIDDIENRLLDEEVEVRRSLSEQFDTNITDALTEFIYTQQALEATLRIASQTLQLNLLSFL